MLNHETFQDCKAAVFHNDHTLLLLASPALPIATPPCDDVIKNATIATSSYPLHVYISMPSGMN